MEQYLELLCEQNAQIIALLESINDELNWAKDLSLGTKVVDALNSIESDVKMIEVQTR